MTVILDGTLGVSTSGSIELGHASDTTLTRTAAGQIAVEGSAVILASAAASQAEQETASATGVFVSPGRQQFHPSAAKAWVRGSMSGVTGVSYNVTSITDVGTGQVRVNFDVDFSDVTYAISATASSNTDIWGQQYPTAGAAAVGSCGLGFFAGNRAATDPDIFYATFFGDQ